MKPNVFTANMNAREVPALTDVLEWLLGSEPNVNVGMYVERRVMEVANTYQEAVDYMRTVPLLASAYYIVGGARPGIVQLQMHPLARFRIDSDTDYRNKFQLFYEQIARSFFIGEGIVIERNATGVNGERTLQPDQPNGWYLLQTNYDHLKVFNSILHSHSRMYSHVCFLNSHLNRSPLCCGDL